MENRQWLDIIMMNAELLESILSAPLISTIYAVVVTELLNKYQWIGMIDDINRAVKLVEKVVESTSADHLNHIIRLNNLRITLWR